MTNHLFVADFGGNIWHVYCCATGAFFTFTTEEFFCIVNWLPTGSILIIEKAHMTPRSDYSLAQVYTAEELMAFHQAIKDHNCKLLLFPQGLTPKARAEAKLSSKSDQNDLLAIATYVQNHPELKLCKLPETFVTERRREAAWSFKTENDGILNVARRFNYKADNDAVIDFLNTNLEELVARLSPATRSIMMVDDSHRHSRTKEFKKTGSGARNARLYTLLALYLHPKGYARTRPDTGDIPGITWTCRYVLGMSPFHFKGGIARSNLNWHAFRNFAINEMDTRKAGKDGKVLAHYNFDADQQSEFRSLRKKFKRATIETMRVMKDMISSKVQTGEIPMESAANIAAQSL